MSAIANVILGVFLACNGKTSSEPGFGDTGQEARPTSKCPDSPWVYVEAGILMACGIHADGCSECWGKTGDAPIDSDDRPDSAALNYEYAGEGDPPQDLGLQSIFLPFDGIKDTSSLWACGVGDGNVGSCWGWDRWGWTDIPSKHGFTSMGLNGYRSVGVTATGGFVCWPEDQCENVIQSPDRIDFAEVNFNFSVVARMTDGSFNLVSSELSPLPDEANEFVHWDSMAGRVYGVTDTGTVQVCGSTSGCEKVDSTDGLSDFCVTEDWWCGIESDDGAIRCERLSTTPNWPEPPEGSYEQIACAYRYACAIETGGDDIACWGEDYDEMWGSVLAVPE